MSTAVKRIMRILQGYSSLQVVFGGPKGDTAMDARIILFDDNMQEIISGEIQSYLDKEEKISLIANVLLDDGSVACIEPASHLAHSLRHHSSLKSNMTISHVTFDLSARRKCRHGVNYDQRDCL